MFRAVLYRTCYRSIQSSCVLLNGGLHWNGFSVPEGNVLKSSGKEKLLSKIQSIKKYVHQLYFHKQLNMTYFSQIILDKYQNQQDKS